MQEIPKSLPLSLSLVTKNERAPGSSATPCPRWLAQLQRCRRRLGAVAEVLKRGTSTWNDVQCRQFWRNDHYQSFSSVLSTKMLFLQIVLASGQANSWLLNPRGQDHVEHALRRRVDRLLSVAGGCTPWTRAATLPFPLHCRLHKFPWPPPHWHFGHHRNPFKVVNTATLTQHWLVFSQSQCGLINLTKSHHI